MQIKSFCSDVLYQYGTLLQTGAMCTRESFSLTPSFVADNFWKTNKNFGQRSFLYTLDGSVAGDLFKLPTAPIV